MDEETFEGKALPYVLATPAGFEAGRGYPLVILLHGFGANMYDLAPLARYIDESNYVYAFPNGPFSVNLGFGMGASWSGERPGVMPPPPGTPPLDELLTAFVEEVRQQTGTDPGNMVLGGFSQGGGQTLRFGLPRPEMFRALIVMSGSFRSADDVRERLPAERTQPIFLAHGSMDRQIAIESGRNTKAFLEDAGYGLEYHEYDMGHEINDAELRDLRPWLHKVAPPLPKLSV
jgi:phospholipase/carboxylesterase